MEPNALRIKDEPLKIWRGAMQDNEGTEYDLFLIYTEKQVRFLQGKKLLPDDLQEVIGMQHAAMIQQAYFEKQTYIMETEGNLH